MRRIWLSCAFFAAFSGILNTGCMSAYRKSMGTDTDLNFSRIYLTDFNTAWQAVLDALKAIPADVTNREAGFIQTRWSDNTSLKNFTDSFGAADTYLKSQYRLKVNVSKEGNYNGSPSPAVKITVQKDQIVQRDVLDGWRPVETDTIEENTLLYRIGRLILLRMKLANIEEDKIKKGLENTPFQ
jgi:hypothetical protein